MPTGERSMTIRLSEDELEKLESLRKWLQEEMGPLVRVTQRMTVLRALEELQKRNEKLERDKARKR